MLKSLLAFISILVVALPANAKPNGVYPVSCDNLWAAVKDSLESPGNYAIMSMNDVKQTASFTVVGNFTAYTDKIALVAQDGACALKSAFLQVGPDDSDSRQFHHRLARSLSRLQAAKPQPSAKSSGQL